LFTAIIPSAIYDKYKVTEENKDYYAEYYSGIRDFTLKHDLDFHPNPKHWIKAGLISIFHRFNPHAFVEVDIPNKIQLRDITYINGIETGIYAEDTWQPLTAFKINAGLRYSYFIADKERYHNPEPRLSAACRLSPDLAVKASYASMNQYIHLLTNTGISLPTDLWVPATDRVKPQKSKQIALSIVRDFSKNGISFSLEGYYKTMDDVIGYKEGASFFEIGEPSEVADIKWEDNVTTGRSWSYGLELLLQKKEGNLTGWIGYTLSWTQMQFDSLNFGRKFYARYDRRHDISVVVLYKLSEKINLSGTWVYGTGNAVTLPLSGYPAEYHNFQGLINNDPSNPNPAGYTGPEKWFTANEYGYRNNFRMKPYHRLDLGVQFHKKKKWGERIWEISVYNAYCRFNPFFYYNETETRDNKKFGVLYQVSLFPIIPSITYSFKF
jgi:outer membrane receptor protein involved in Fe transport